MLASSPEQARANIADLEEGKASEIVVELSEIQEESEPESSSMEVDEGSEESEPVSESVSSSVEVGEVRDQ